MLIFSVSGLRGIVGNGLDPAVITRYVAAFVTCLKRGPVMLGQDTRPSGEALRRIVAGTLVACGRTVLDAGVAPTPTIQFAVQQRKAAGGIVVTASHNPLEWNALKFLGAGGRCIGPMAARALQDAERNGAHAWSPAAGFGHIECAESALAGHRDAVLQHPLVDAPAIRKRKFRVVVDAVNGAGGVLIPELLTSLGCRVTVLHGEPSGEFARGPEPVPANLQKLGRLVKRERADVGFGLDPDGDRLAVVDETGAPIGEDYTLACVADYVLQHARGPVVTNLSTSLAVDAAARRHRTRVVRTPVGEINVIEEMLRRRCTLAGEGNGGVILRGLAPGRDAAIGAALFLRWMADDKAPLSMRRRVLPEFVMIKGKTAGDRARFRTLIRTADKAWSGVERDTRDGVRYAADDWWVHIRRSNTEPIIRVIAEAPTHAAAAALLRALDPKLQTG